jgi:uncharacterized membrane protein YdjX (TVP38/TMEM64 family)
MTSDALGTPENFGAKTASTIALVLAIACFLVPFIGALFLPPFAILAICIGLYKGDFKNFSVASTVIIIINYFISPTFWLAAASADRDPRAGATRFLLWIAIIGSMVMIGLVIRLYLTSKKGENKE